MTTPKQKFTNIDDYIASFPEDIQAILEALRQTIKQVAPSAEEVISYQMPTFKLNGNLVHFAAFKNHIGLYPTPGAIEALGEDVQQYKSSKGTLQFPIDEPMPLELIAKIVEYRVQENLAKQKK